MISDLRATCDRETLCALEIERLREALVQIVDEKCDYMRINNLGDPETQHTVKTARAALSQITRSEDEV